MQEIILYLLTLALVIYGLLIPAGRPLSWPMYTNSSRIVGWKGKGREQTVLLATDLLGIAPDAHDFGWPDLRPLSSRQMLGFRSEGVILASQGCVSFRFDEGGAVNAIDDLPRLEAELLIAKAAARSGVVSSSDRRSFCAIFNMDRRRKLL